MKLLFAHRQPIAPKPVTKPKLQGLGDVVAVVAQPIARVIDRMTQNRTHLANCARCKTRQQTLNQILPFK